LFLLKVFRQLRRKHSQARLLFIGPLLESDYGRRFLRALRTLRGAAYRPAVPPQQMLGVYAAADAVVNSSLSEGMSNALLEAMAAGVPVLARAIEGNRALLRHPRAGLLFSTERSFLRQASRLLEDAALRQGLAGQAYRQVLARHSASGEAWAHRRLYFSLCKRSPDVPR